MSTDGQGAGTAPGLNRRSSFIVFHLTHLLTAAIGPTQGKRESWAMDPTAWPYGQGEMAERISTHDWAATPLGAIQSWPQSLKTSVELMLASGFPASIQWGREAVFLYNDAKARILGSLHPGALGVPGLEALPVAWSGESVIFGEQRYVIHEKGGEREIWVDHLASPIRDGAGAIGGIWTILIDVTARVQAERRRKEAEDALRKNEVRQTFLLWLSDQFRGLTDPAAILATGCRMTGEHFGVNRCCYGDIIDDEILYRCVWTREVAPIPERVAFAEFVTVVAEGYRAGRAVVADDIDNDERITDEERERLRANRTLAFVCVKLRGKTVFSVHSAVPRAWTASEVEQIREAGERTQHAARRARAEASLRDSEERFRQFAEASTDVIWIRNAKSLQLEYWSPGFEHTFGDKWVPALGGDNLKDWLEIVVPEDREQASDTIARVQSGKRVTFDYRIERPSDGEIRWTRSSVFPLLDAAGGVQRIGSVCHDATEEKAATDRMENMVAELQHRTRNLMAVLQSIVARTLAASEDLDSFKLRIDERLTALSRVHRLLSRSEQEPITIGALVHLELDELGSDVRDGRVDIRGPEVRLRNSTVQLLALALHELATDAVRQGALSEQGSLRIGWQVEQIRGAPHLRLNWIEEHPVCVAVPRDRRGYGQELIERALPYSLNAETRYELDETGLQCTIALPLTKEGSKERGA
jgi:PAS domain S-box-containing protein